VTATMRSRLAFNAFSLTPATGTHCPTERSALFHLRRLWISFTDQAHTHTHARKRARIPHSCIRRPYESQGINVSVIVPACTTRDINDVPDEINDN
jgi:hypothetical protein